MGIVYKENGLFVLRYVNGTGREVHEKLKGVQHTSDAYRLLAVREVEAENLRAKIKVQRPDEDE